MPVGATLPSSPSSSAAPFFLRSAPLLSTTTPRRTTFRLFTTTTTTTRSCLSSPRPPPPLATRRANHLRPKLLTTVRPPPPPPPTHRPIPGSLQSSPLQESSSAVESPPPPIKNRRRLPEGEHETPEKLQLLPLPSRGFGTTFDSHLLLVDEEEEEFRSEELVVHHQMQGQHPFPPSDHRDVPRLLLLLDLAPYLLGLLALQTLCSVWLFGASATANPDGKMITSVSAASAARGGGGAKVAGEGKVVVAGTGTAAETGEGEFEKAVSAIQAMAREARAAEAAREDEMLAKERVSSSSMMMMMRGDDDVITDEVNRQKRRLGGFRKKSPQLQALLLDVNGGAQTSSVAERDGSESASWKKTRLRNSAASAMSLIPPKGFNGSKNHTAPTKEDPASGGIWPTEHDHHLKDFRELHDRRQEALERLESGHSTSISGMEDGCSSQNFLKDGTSFKKGTSCRRTSTIRKFSGMENKFMEPGTPSIQDPIEKSLRSSSISGDGLAHAEIGTGETTIESKSLLKKVKDLQAHNENQFWWLKLPYVLAIFLHRGSDRKGFKGLYSLKMDSHSNGESSSYSVLFEDRGNATNFCYLLELFFEDLDDFSADIVPLSIQEVHEAVKSRALKVIVVRKGQLQLYAGQPLVEVEMALRSMLEL